MRWKPYLIGGLCCVGLGMGLMIAGTATGAFDVARRMEILGRGDQTDTITQSFSGVLVEVESAQVTIRPGDTPTVIATGVPLEHYQVEVTDEMLCVTQEDTPNQWIQVSFWLPQPQITITLPESEYRMLGLNLDYGDCTIQGLHCNTLSLALDAGDCEIRQVETGALTIQSDCGDCAIQDTAVTGGCAAKLDSGSCTITNTTIGGLCKVESQLGDVSLGEVAYGTGEMDLTCGDLRLRAVTQSDKTGSTRLSAALGDITLTDGTLWNSQIDLDCGDLTADSTALSGATTITSDLGDIDLILAGTQADYQIYQSISTGSPASGNVIQIQQKAGGTEVSFTD